MDVIMMNLERELESLRHARAVLTVKNERLKKEIAIIDAEIEELDSAKTETEEKK